ncbi:MAG: peptidoglycan DD-metalloendopeptidase family protein [Chitinophagales bacterium]|nr:peptidoglycan DD-metalloendopeptidase family protein [Chitinophagales bacterium]
MPLRYFIIGCCVLLCCFGVLAQSKKELETRKKQLYKDIDAAQKLLRNTQKNKAASLNELILLERKVNSREQVINNIEGELSFLEQNVAKTARQIDSLENKLQALREGYAQSVRQSYLTQNNYSRLLFLFSAKSFNDAYKRIKYMQYYRQHRKDQVADIEIVRQGLVSKAENLRREKAEQVSLLDNAQKEQEILKSEKKQQNAVFKQLKGREKEIKSSLDRKQRAIDDLNRQIRDIVSAAISSEKRSSSRTAPKDQSPEALKLSADFSKNKGKLLWPVEEGIITGYFGTHAHPLLKNIYTTNNGIDISTDPNTPVRAIFEGKVINILFNPNFHWAVIIKHGNYFSVYTQLREVSVAKNDVIKMKQNIGIVNTNGDDGKTEVHFELWEGADKLNPAVWLK